jgi:hypothetical protein
MESDAVHLYGLVHALSFCSYGRGCPGLVPNSITKFYYAKRKFPITSKYRQMHGVLNVDEIKN